MASVLIEESFEIMESEEYAVKLWRRDQFGRLGFDPTDALRLAESAADLGQARGLRRAGCPVELAFRILI
jgi:hypothetical protein